MSSPQFFVGIDFGKTNVRFAVSGERPELDYFAKRPYQRGSVEEMQRMIFEGIDEAIQKSGRNREFLKGIGMAVPAVVDRKIAVTVEQLRAAKSVVAFACGDDRALAVLGAMRTGLVSSLFIDQSLAERVLDEISAEKSPAAA